MKFRRPSGFRRPGRGGYDEQVQEQNDQHTYAGSRPANGGYPQHGGTGGYGPQQGYGGYGYGQPPSGAQGGYGQPAQGAQSGYAQPTQGAQGGYAQPTQGAQGGYAQLAQGAQGGYAQPAQGAQGAQGGYAHPAQGAKSGYPGLGQQQGQDLYGGSQPYYRGDGYPEHPQGFGPQSGGQQPYGYNGRPRDGGPTVRISARPEAQDGAGRQQSSGYRPGETSADGGFPGPLGGYQTPPLYPGLGPDFSPGYGNMLGGGTPFPSQLPQLPAAPPPVTGEIVEPVKEAANNKSLFSLANLTEIKGFVDRLGGIDGILSTMTKFQKVVTSVQSMAPLVKVLFSGLGSKKASTTASEDDEASVEWRPKRRRKRKLKKQPVQRKRRKSAVPSKPLRYRPRRATVRRRRR